MLTSLLVYCVYHPGEGHHVLSENAFHWRDIGDFTTYNHALNIISEMNLENRP